MDRDGEDEVLAAGNAELVPFTGAHQEPRSPKYLVATATATAMAMAVPVPMDLDGEDDAPAAAPFTGAAGRGMRLSDLPDDVLALILSRIGYTSDAAKLSILSHRWRCVWYKIPSLTFLCLHPRDASSVRAVLASRGTAKIHDLVVRSVCDATPEATASWLRLAEPLVTRDLIFRNRFSVSEETLNQELIQEELFQEVVEERGAFELPCFKKATKICLSLGFLGLSLPRAGIFAALKVLRLEYVQFHGDCTLDDGFCPFLRMLDIRMSRGSTSLKIRLNSLIQMHLSSFRWFRRLDVVAPKLKILNVSLCFAVQLPEVCCIVAEGLEILRWMDCYHPVLFRFSKMPCLQLLSPSHVYPYGGLLQIVCNNDWERLLKINLGNYRLDLIIKILLDLRNYHFLLEGTNRLPDIKILCLDIHASSHAYGATVLHFLTMCNGIRELSLTLKEVMWIGLCSLNCICHQPHPSLRAQNVLVQFLEEIKIFNFGGKEHEVDFVKLLFEAAPTLRRMRIVCHSSFAGWQKLSEVLQSCARQETSVEVTSPLLPR